MTSASKDSSMKLWEHDPIELFQDPIERTQAKGSSPKKVDKKAEDFPNVLVGNGHLGLSRSGPEAAKNAKFIKHGPEFFHASISRTISGRSNSRATQKAKARQPKFAEYQPQGPDRFLSQSSVTRLAEVYKPTRADKGASRMGGIRQVKAEVPKPMERKPSGLGQHTEPHWKGYSIRPRTYSLDPNPFRALLQMESMTRK